MKLQADADCLGCGGELVVVTVGKPVATETTTVLRCVTCSAEWAFHLRVHPVGSKAGQIVRRRFS